MLPSNIDVEYVIRKRQAAFSDLPAEYRGLPLEIEKQQSAWRSRFLLSLSDWLIKTGCAIKESQAAAREQRIYS